MLACNQFARAGNTGLHLISDHHDAIVITKLADGFDQIFRGGIEAAFALHGFKDDRGHAGRVQIGLEQLGDARHRILGRNAVNFLREGDVIDVGHHRAEALLVGINLAGQRHAQEGAAMEGPAKGDDGIAARGDARNLDRVFHSLGARGHEHGFLGEIARNSGVQTLGQTDVVFIGQHLMAGVREFRQLLGHGVHHLGVAMAGVDHGDTGGKVDIAVALDVPDFRVQRALDIDLGLNPDPARDVFVPTRGDFCVFHLCILRRPVGLGRVWFRVASI